MENLRPGTDLQLLPSFLASVQEADKDSKTALCVGDDRAYLGWFIAPGCCVRAFSTNQLRFLFTTDAAHCKGPEKGLLPGFHCFGPSDELVTLAAAHILGESEASWKWFILNLCCAFHQLADVESHIITDGEKGLMNAIRDCLPNAYHASCSFHRSAKLSDHYTTRPLFLKMAGSYTLQQYTEARIEREKRAGHGEGIDTIDKVAPNLFCLAHMPTNVDEAAFHWHECTIKECKTKRQ